MYKLWNQKNDDDKNDENALHEYENKNQKKFKNSFRHHYKGRISNFIIRI